MPLESDPVEIDLTQIGDPRDAVHLAVAALAQKGRVALPTAAGYACLTSALELEPSEGPRPALVLLGAGELPDWAVSIPAAVQRLTRRTWPGPVVLRVGPGVLFDRLPSPAREALAPDGRLELTAPADPLVRAIAELAATPLALIPSPAGAQLVLDSGPISYVLMPAMVEVDGAGGWSIVDPGILAADDVTRLAAFQLLFVCTGNTCRSPMAEGLCRLLLARRLGCEPQDLPARGYEIASAGVCAGAGMPAAAHAAEVLRRQGGSIDTHASQPVTDRLVARADLILTMTADHLDALLDVFPEAEPRARLLHADGQDIDDPIGASLDTYEQTAQQIARQIEHLLDELGVA
jgi:protein-tyrosine phosphatase